MFADLFLIGLTNVAGNRMDSQLEIVRLLTEIRDNQQRQLRDRLLSGE